MDREWEARDLAYTRDFDTLSGYVDRYIDNHLIDHLGDLIKSTMSRLINPIRTPYYNFVRSMVIGSTITTHTETCLNLLIYFCNALAKESNSLQYEPDEYTFRVMEICADNDDWKRNFPDRYGSGIGPNDVYYNDTITDKSDRLMEMVKNTWKLVIENEIRRYAQLMTRPPHNIKAPSDYIEGIFWSFITTFYQFNQDISSTGFTIIACKPVGKLIVDTIHDIEVGEKLLNLEDNGKTMCAIVQYALNVFKKYYHIAEDHQSLLDDSISYCIEFGCYRMDGRHRKDYRKAVRLYLDEDPAFKYLVESTIDDSDNEFGDNEKTIGEFLYSRAARFHLEDRPQIPTMEASRGFKPKYMTNADEDTSNLPYEDEERETQQEQRQKKSDVEIVATQSKKGYHKSSKIQSDMTNKIYRAYRKYKNGEAKVDSQMDKMVQSMKNAFTGNKADSAEAVIDGKRFTPLTILKTALHTIALFSFGWIKGILLVLVTWTLHKKRLDSQRREVILSLEEEIKLLDEKIEDARGDGNRKAKYALMRTKAELEHARDKVKYNLNATSMDLKTAANYIRHPDQALRVRRDVES